MSDHIYLCLPCLLKCPESRGDRLLKTEIGDSVFFFYNCLVTLGLIASIGQWLEHWSDIPGVSSSNPGLPLICGDMDLTWLIYSYKKPLICVIHGTPAITALVNEGWVEDYVLNLS